MSYNLSIIVPAYNESARIGRTLHAIFDYLEQHEPASELIVVDDGSRDNTTEISKEVIAARSPSAVEAYVITVRPNRGKGHAVRTGLLAAHAPVALFSDADLSAPIEEAPKLVEPIRAGDYDLVFGSRAVDRSLIGTHQSWRREQGGRAFNLVVSLSTGLPFRDTQCGFKAFRMDVCRPIIKAATIDRFAFDVELLFVAHRAGLRLLEQPVRWNHFEGGSVSYLSDSLRMIREVRATRRLARAGFYDQAISRARRRAGLAPRAQEEKGERRGLAASPSLTKPTRK